MDAGESHGWTASEPFLEFCKKADDGDVKVSDMVPPDLRAAVSPQDWRTFVDEVNRPLENYAASIQMLDWFKCAFGCTPILVFAFFVAFSSHTPDLPFVFPVVLLTCATGFGLVVCWNQKRRNDTMGEIAEACRRASSRIYGVSFGMKQVPVEYRDKKKTRTVMMPAISVVAGDMDITVGNQQPRNQHHIEGMDMGGMAMGGMQLASAPPPPGFPGMGAPLGGGMGLPPQGFAGQFQAMAAPSAHGVPGFPGMGAPLGGGPPGFPGMGAPLGSGMGLPPQGFAAQSAPPSAPDVPGFPGMGAPLGGGMGLPPQGFAGQFQAMAAPPSAPGGGGAGVPNF